MRDVLTRQVLLVLVEYTNFAAAYYAFFHALPGLLASSVALEFASLYALGHNIYKFRDGSVWRVLTHRKSVFLTILSTYFLVRHGDLTEQAFVDRSFWADALLMGLIALWYVLGIWLML